MTTDTATLAQVELRAFDTLGAANHGWLDARHHFSFASYHDPARMGWGPLRVWNDDHIAAKSGFPPHSHADMEIITYVRKGAITHKDSLGNEGRTEAGDVQVMSAGSGIQHAEYNLEPDETSLFQIWIMPRERGGKPSWGARPFPKADRTGQMQVLASGYDGDGDALPIRADGRVYGATMVPGATITHDIAGNRLAYLVAARGKLVVNGVTVDARDGLAIRGGRLEIRAEADSEFVMVETAE
ncbi:putative quercetin 2,3-dioxygenase [Alteripontixanthobacter maritimus]|uniref:Putative quercetin 2,3-dioxygenase n=1 Tax=Alteripontixanthobacter maritimus TaxID=2161824 RepID=A0A369Q2J6_9SPHN|nr:pirin family protein [Alteripontixanthobacter maritimus]RDC59123.1 putative quercetin 2,3-dioxygenase [Alteripontixanthobacter maritimus]